MFKTAKWIGAERILEKKTDYLSPAVMLRKRFVLTDLNNKDGKTLEISKPKSELYLLLSE